MDSDPLVYGLDIETDTATDGLNPLVGRILAVAVAGPEEDTVFTDHDEATLLRQVDHHLATTAPGVLVTWNGAAFDLPYLSTRAQLNQVVLGLRLQLDPLLGLRGSPLPGHDGAYRGGWHHHRHLDAYRVYRGDVGRSLQFSCGLKSIARLAGLQPVDHDAARVHELSPDQLRDYVASDARCARQLALLRWPTAHPSTDRLIGELPSGGPARFRAPAGALP